MSYSFPKHFDTNLIYIYISIGWQAYRGDQIHRKNSPTLPRSQIQAKKKQVSELFKLLFPTEFGKSRCSTKVTTINKHYINIMMNILYLYSTSQARSQPLHLLYYARAFLAYYRFKKTRTLCFKI